MAYQTIYPYTNEVLHTFDNMTDQDLADVLERAHLLYKKWRKEDHLEERKAQLHQVANILRRDRDKYAEIMTKDMGKLFTEAQGEVDLCADIADYYADKADEFLMSTPLETDSGQAYYLKQSTGVILAVEPWNFPYYQIMRVFAPNFIVGNPMVLKHASICPRSAQSFEELVLEAGAEAGSITNLFISYDQVSQVIADKRVVGVCLTGSERGGASIAEEAGKNLKKTTLELGGDDAFIILDDADWDQLEKVLYFSRLYNAGQVCTSSKRFIVLDKDYDRFKELLTKVFKTAKWGDPMDPETTLAPLSSAQAKADVLDQIKLALDHGAELVYGGEAIEVANDSNYGLGGTIFSSNQEHAKAVAAKIETGMSFINSGWTSLPELPFGGVKHSGYGRELSELGFTSFVNEHLIYIPNKTNNSNTKV
ncbi:TPA: aldehyde dehydrogenase family protein [Streptococcus pyogenes]|nr:aldehyde dehydrogenase family protein [Streptococcus pyogenes]HEP4023345.1 aldehyde dehydrogenase family protein [Streptococcus pyogenes]HEP4231920.1 aldehyde dehydrogenase family protein [Streptococcus pyogenes]HEP5235365.1 aldehyde dehydrogenase family protein [Streptococcus pyogenes]